MRLVASILLVFLFCHGVVAQPQTWNLRDDAEWASKHVCSTYSNTDQLYEDFNKKSGCSVHGRAFCVGDSVLFVRDISGKIVALVEDAEGKTGIAIQASSNGRLWSCFKGIPAKKAK